MAVSKSTWDELSMSVRPACRLDSSSDGQDVSLR